MTYYSVIGAACIIPWNLDQCGLFVARCAATAHVAAACARPGHGFLSLALRGSECVRARRRTMIARWLACFERASMASYQPAM